MQRDDFDANTKDVLAKRVNMRCSNPDCDRGTAGPREDPSKAVNVGVAAHITAASEGGPRYDASLMPEARRAIDNAIWLCQTCAKLVDNDTIRYTVGNLRAWKRDAEEKARQNLVKPSDVGDLRLRVCSTRFQRRQLAQFHLYNASTRPIYIDGWVATWGPEDDPHLLESRECYRGALPKRLEVHDAYDFTVPLDRHPVETLARLGVKDPTGAKWFATDAQLYSFKQTAAAHKPPPPPPKPDWPSDEEIKACTVEIRVAKRDLPGGTPTLDIFFKNLGPHRIPVRGLELKWAYEPPRCNSPEGQPQVMETEGSVHKGVGKQPVLLSPDQEHRFTLDPDFASILVGTLAPDVSDKNISVTVICGEQIGWNEADGIGPVVREVAQAVVASWDR